MSRSEGGQSQSGFFMNLVLRLHQRHEDTKWSVFITDSDKTFAFIKSDVEMGVRQHAHRNPEELVFMDEGGGGGYLRLLMKIKGQIKIHYYLLFIHKASCRFNKSRKVQMVKLKGSRYML